MATLWDNVSCGVIVHAPDTRILRANPAACQVTGLTLAQMQGMAAIDPYWSFIREDGATLPRHHYPVNLVIATHRPVQQMVIGIRRPDEAGPRWVQLDAYPVFGAGRVLAQVVVTFADITHLKLAEKTARRLNRSLRVLSSCRFDDDDDDEQRLFTRICDSVVEAGGYAHACVILATDEPGLPGRVVATSASAGDYAQGLQVSSDPDSPKGQGPFGLAVRSGQAQVNQDWIHNPVMAPWRERALQHGFLSSVALPLKVERRVIGILSLYGYELDAFGPEELPPLEDLAAKLSTSITALRARRQRDRAEDASRAKSAFLANMSHEIRTPLNAIIGLNYLIRLSGVTPEQGQRLERMETASRHLLALISDILDLAKIESGKAAIEAANFHLSSVLDAVASMVGEAARTKGLQVDLDTNAVPLWLRGDATKLRQALLNLASNAVKFTDHGQVSLKAKLLAEDADGLRVRFSVTDTGIGVPAEDLDRIFEDFEQVDSTGSRRHGGTGLGLAITRRLVELMGGRCGVESRLGVGSTFWFELTLHRGHGPLPVAAAPAAAERLPQSPPPPSQQLRQRWAGLRVLVAEDNEVNQEVLAAMLHAVGLDVVLASDGQQALALALRGDCALALMDMQMPGIDGLEVTRRLRREPVWGRRPIIALTANAFDDHRQACLAAGMDDFLTKPTEAKLLYETLWRILSAQLSAGA